MNDIAAVDYQKEAMIVTGELNFTTVVRLWKDSLPKLATYSSLHFDLAKVTASDSGGVALILEWVKYAKKQNKLCPGNE